VELQAQDICVPGDISSAAFLMVAALITPGSELLIRSVGVNPTRTGVIDVLRSMGGCIELVNEREVSGEPVADILVRYSRLKGITIAGDVVPRAIDEFPAICVAAACAEGTTTVRDARELRVKETDRITAMATNLRLLGVPVDECADGMDITGVERLGSAVVDSCGDHRIAMSLSVAGLVSSGGITINDIDCVATSFPTFFSLLERFRKVAP
jgi:3-phosphoshikimate 1-carboxyvinyltransferase